MNRKYKNMHLNNFDKFFNNQNEQNVQVHISQRMMGLLQNPVRQDGWDCCKTQLDRMDEIMEPGLQEEVTLLHFTF